MNRRQLLQGAAVVSIGLPAGAHPAPSDTPILRLFRRHQALIDEANAHAFGDLSVTDEEMNRLFFDEADDLEAELMAEPCTCAADFAAKVIVDTSRGGNYRPWEDGGLWREARDLVGMAHPV